MVSSSSTTGVKESENNEQISYFERIQTMNLRSGRLIGFGISDKSSFLRACNYANGAIIGSAFVTGMAGDSKIEDKVSAFMQKFF